MTHLINRLRFEISCDSEDTAFALQHQLAPALQQQVSNALEKAATKIALTDEWVQIDNIEVDLGSINFNTPESLLEAEIEFQLLQQLGLAKQMASAGGRASKGQTDNTELFSYFMNNGVLPWWAQELQPDMNDVLTTLITEKKQWLINYLYEQRTVARFWKRIIFQFNPDTKQALFTLPGELREALKEIQQVIKMSAQYSTSPGINSVKRKEITNEGVKVALPEARLIDVLLTEAQHLYAGVQANKLFQTLQVIAIKHHLIAKGESAIPAINIPVGSNENEGTEITNDQTGALLDQGTRVDETAILAAETNSIDATEKYFVHYAGMILLAPFLRPFFNTLSLLEDGKWKDVASTYKAVYLLRYLARGDRTVAEYNLVFEKVICGLSPADPIPLDPKLEVHEIEEADTLLKDIIGHWKAIKNTSVNGLRKTFLERDGIISGKENGWLLQVERKTEDVLLDMVPWGYSVAQFPWNKSIIYTEW